LGADLRCFDVYPRNPATTIIKLIGHGTAISVAVGQNGDKETVHMKRTILAGSVAACFCLGLAGQLLAAEPPVTSTTNHPSPGEQNVSAIKPAAKCLSDLRAFDDQMEKDGYWRGGSRYGYGYPMGGFGYGDGYQMSGGLAPTATGYRDVRPGYEVRTLVASANILARHGQQQQCDDVLAATRSIYKLYVADLHARGVHTADVPGWRKQQIAAAQPVASAKISFRSDELVGTEVRNPENQALGSVDDLVTSPQTGKIAYLVIGRGGIFGIDEKYVPVPWADFKVTPNANLLVLDTTKGAMDVAPEVDHDQFATPSRFDQESQKVDAYWKTHLSKSATGSNG
jgi:sporulation protein YlmC with PRC-barrel domain